MLKKGKMSLSEHEAKFIEKLRFARRLCLDDESVVTRYVEGLPSNYREAVRREISLNGAMLQARLVGDDLKLKEEKMKVAGEKRKVAESSNSSKKFKDGLNKKMKRKRVRKCFRCNSMHFWRLH